jgi:hypothetical protein
MTLLGNQKTTNPVVTEALILMTTSSGLVEKVNERDERCHWSERSAAAIGVRKMPTFLTNLKPLHERRRGR